MRVLNQNDPLAETFSKQLLDIGNGKMSIDPNTKKNHFAQWFL